MLLLHNGGIGAFVQCRRGLSNWLGWQECRRRWLMLLGIAWQEVRLRSTVSPSFEKLLRLQNLSRGTLLRLRLWPSWRSVARLI